MRSTLELARSCRRFFLAAGGMLLLIVCAWPARGIDLNCALPARRLRQDQGHAFSATLPALALLFSSADDSDHPRRSKTIVLEDGRPLGPAHSPHIAIREDGAGAYSIWRYNVYLSSSDNSDPRKNGRSYSLRANLRQGTGAYVFGLVLVTMGLFLERRAFGAALQWLRGDPVAAPRPKLGMVRGALATLAVVVFLPLFFLVAGEIWIRLSHPGIFIQTKSSYRWSPEGGFTYEPHSLLLDTNHLDYWVRQRVNAYGFPDRDWSPAKPPGVFRVEFIGNSYVAATQVPIADKLQVQFEQLADRAFSPTRFETAALGFGGTGQANQLQYYDTAGRQFRPNVVVLVFNYSDFSYNSALLECLRYGWNPDHLPRLFLVQKTPGGPFSPAPIESGSQSYRLPEPPVPAPPAKTWVASAEDWLLARSCFCLWLTSSTPLGLPQVGRGSAQSGPPLDITSERIAAIEGMSGYAHAFDGWHYPHDWDAETMFGAQHLPPVFQGAIDATGAALDAFLERGRRDGFRLVIMTNELVSRETRDEIIERETGNRGLERGFFVRIKRLADERGIPVVDLTDYETKHGIDAVTARWDHDLHWNPYGHKVAASALIEEFEAHRDWLPPSGTPR